MNRKWVTQVVLLATIAGLVLIANFVLGPIVDSPVRADGNRSRGVANLGLSSPTVSSGAVVTASSDGHGGGVGPTLPPLPPPPGTPPPAGVPVPPPPVPTPIPSGSSDGHGGGVGPTLPPITGTGGTVGTGTGGFVSGGGD